MDHILGCADELFPAGDIEMPDSKSLEANLSEKTSTSNCNKPKRSVSNTGNDGQ